MKEVLYFLGSIKFIKSRSTYFFINDRSFECCLKKDQQLINLSNNILPNRLYQQSLQDGGLSSKESSRLENQLNQQLMCLSNKVAKFIHQNRKQSSALDQLFNFLIATQQDITAIYSNSKRMQICRFIIERVGIDIFQSLDTKKFTDLKWLVEQFYQQVKPIQLKLLMAYLEVTVRFHKPFHPLGFYQFWKEVERAINEDKCSKEIQTFLKKLNFIQIRKIIKIQKIEIDGQTLYLLHLVLFSSNQLVMSQNDSSSFDLQLDQFIKISKWCLFDLPFSTLCINNIILRQSTTCLFWQQVKKIKIDDSALCVVSLKLLLILLPR